MCTKGCYHCDMLTDIIEALLAINKGSITIPLSVGYRPVGFDFWTTEMEGGLFYLNFQATGGFQNVIN